MLQPEKATTPATPALGFTGHERVAPAGVVRVRVTEAELLVTVLPLPSSTVTTGWVPKTALAAETAGVVLKASWAAAPGVMVKLLLTELASPLAAAVKV
jgi:hypothetical protein